MEVVHFQERPKVAIYCRLSDEDHNKKNPEEDSRSIQTQKAMLMEYALSQNWEIYDIYSDDDFSGADANRPDYNRLLSDASQRKFSIVLCKHQSRFTRDMVHVEKYINDKFTEWGIRYVSLLDGADTAVAGNKKSRQINGLVNEWYLEDLSENVRAAYKTRKKQGKYLASCVVYGYQRDPEDKYHLIIDETAAAVVRRIFDMCIQGMSLNCIAQKLNEDGILPPARYKTEMQGLNFKGAENLRKNTRFQGKSLWQSSSVMRILQNEVYTGGLYQNRQRTVSYKNSARIKLPREEWIICTDTHEPIVNKETFDLACRMRKQRPQVTSNGQSHLFTGKLMCGKCGGSVSYNSGTEKNRYYRCQRATNLGPKVCTGLTVSENLLTRTVLTELKSIFENWIQAKDVQQISDGVRIKENNAKEPLENMLLAKSAEVQKLVDTKVRLYQDMVDGVVSKEEYRELWNQFQERQNALKEEMNNLEERITLEKETKSLKEKRKGELKERVLSSINTYLQCETLTRDMLDAFVDFIEVTTDSKNRKEKIIKIHWNF